MERSKRVSSLFGFLRPLYFSFKYISSKKWIFCILMAAAAIMTVTRLLVPIYIGNSVSAIEAGSLGSVEYFALLIVYISVISGLSRFFVNYLSQYLAQTYAYNLTGDMFSHILRKNFSFYENQTSGDLLSRGTMDVRASMNFILSTMSQLIPTILLIGVAVYFLFSIKPEYALVFALSVPVLVYLGISFQRKQRKHWKNIRNNYGRMNEELQENIVGQRVVRGFSAEDQETEKFTGTTRQYYDEYMEVARLRGLYNNLMPLVISTAATGILLFGGYTTLIAKGDVGPLVSVINIFTMMSFPVGFMGRLIVFSENARASIDRISVVLSESDLEDTDKGEGSPTGAELSMNDVVFVRGKKVVLNGASLKLPRGQILGIGGKTAAGKSTLVSLIPRFYDPDSGSITMDGTDIRRFPLSELRKKVALVPQEISVLSGSFLENIAFGNGIPERERVRWAARIAQISDFIESLPESYDSMIGERGITLSGGQKQRVAVARAVYEKPELLILDDATASVDPKTELNMLNSIRTGLRGTSVLIVTHRKSALKICDMVMELKDGKLVPMDSGTQGQQEGSRVTLDERGGLDVA